MDEDGRLCMCAGRMEVDGKSLYFFFFLNFATNLKMLLKYSLKKRAKEFFG